MTKKLHPWYKHRGYVHFDSPLGIQAAEQLALNPVKVASHAFYPLLRYTVTSEKIKKNRATGKVVSKTKKARPISYAAHADSHIYAYYNYQLGKAYEAKLQFSAAESSVLAFRALGKSNINFANEAFEAIKDMGECIAFATDITGFFDNLRHNDLKRAWAKVLGLSQLPPDHYAVFKSLTQYSYVLKEELFEVLGLSQNNPPQSPARLCSAKDFRSKVRDAKLVVRHTDTKGIPQGSPMSAMLSNIYLFEFDELVQAEISSRGGRYMRYCDDILCIVPASHSDGLSSFVESLIHRYGLDINEKKTETISFSYKSGKLLANRPLQYLGFTFDGTRKIIRSAAFAKFSDKMRRGVSLARQTARKHANNVGGSNTIWRKKLYERYSHLGKRNFISYGFRAAAIMESREIKRQLKPLWLRLDLKIQDANLDLYE